MALDIAASVVNNRRMSSSVSRHNTLAACTPGMEFACGRCEKLFSACTCALGQLKTFVCREDANAEECKQRRARAKTGTGDARKRKYQRDYMRAKREDHKLSEVSSYSRKYQRDYMRAKRASAPKIEYTKPFPEAWEPPKTKARGTATRKDQKIAKSIT